MVDSSFTSAKMLTEFQLYPNVICFKDDTRSAASRVYRDIGRTGYHGYCWKRKLTEKDDGRKRLRKKSDWFSTYVRRATDGLLSSRDSTHV
jgi:hypothetical protein